MSLKDEIKLVCFDFDGTLKPLHGPISKLTIESLNKLHKEGYKLALISGRPGHTAFHLLEEYLNPRIFDYIFGLNGVALLDKDTMTQSYSHYLDIDTIKDVYHKVNDIPYASFGLYHNEDFLVNKVFDEEFIKQAVLSRYMKLKIYDFDKIDFKWPKLFMMHDPKDEKRINDELKKLNLNNVDINRSVNYVVDIMPKGIGKHVAIDKMIELEGIKNENILSFGDADNDIDMIINSVGVAMGNGSDKVKKCAKYICGECDEDGVTDFLIENHFIY